MHLQVLRIKKKHDILHVLKTLNCMLNKNMENTENNVFLNPNLSEEFFFSYRVVALQCM